MTDVETREASVGGRPPTMLQALIPILTLVALLALSVYLYGADSSGGANQIALLLAAGVAAIIGVRNGHDWPSIQRAIVGGIATAMTAILILLCVGALIGTWMLAGTVPAMIYYGLKLLDPRVFYAASCLICALASVSTGSSWTTAGTLGIGLIGVALGLGLSPAITAGAIVSGAYFGDKMSPLSDSTNLAAAVVGTDLFTHIRHMVYTTTPSFIIALLLFAGLGLASETPAEEVGGLETMAALETVFRLGPLALLPLAVVLLLAWWRFPPLPTIFTGALLGAVQAVVLQPDVVVAFVNEPELSRSLALLKGAWSALANGYVSVTGNETVDSLLTRGGMSSMLTTVWLVLCALSFGAVLEHTGLLERLIRSLLAAAKSTGSLITSVLLTCIGTNVIAADQYIAIVLPGRMYQLEFRRRGLHVKNLSRAIEDAGTLTSPLVPWNTCGAYMAATLGVPTFLYLPFAFFNLINPLVSAGYAYAGITIVPAEPEPDAS